MGEINIELVKQFIDEYELKFGKDLNYNTVGMNFNTKMERIFENIILSHTPAIQFEDEFDELKGKLEDVISTNQTYTSSISDSLCRLEHYVKDLNDNVDELITDSPVTLNETIILRIQDLTTKIQEQIDDIDSDVEEFDID